MVGTIVYQNTIYYYIYYLLGESSGNNNNYISVIKIDGANLNPFFFNITTDHRFVFFDMNSNKSLLYDINNF
jgi:hypothetical protein